MDEPRVRAEFENAIKLARSFSLPECRELSEWQHHSYKENPNVIEILFEEEHSSTSIFPFWVLSIRMDNNVGKCIIAFRPWYEKLFNSSGNFIDIEFIMVKKLAHDIDQDDIDRVLGIARDFKEYKTIHHVMVT